ncbi:MAG TPA: amino acid permease [Methanoregulaceae archaeon]|nr:amino acid permease [Methanoregulaceae archaeon]
MSERMRKFLQSYRPIFQTKSINDLLDCCAGEHQLRRVLGPVELIFFGIGAVIGTGIFVITGIAAAEFAGPALVVSFIIAGIVCLFAALSYSEFATMVPIAGSAYSYSYASLGEIFAWIIGWDLILEYSVSVSAVAIGWSGYVTNLLSDLGVSLPQSLVNPPGFNGGVVNLPAMVIIALITVLLVIGVKESARINNVIVAIKVGIVLLFLYLGFSHINPVNWANFTPFGWSGVITGAAIVFFAYIGFDAVSTAGEEVKNPQRDLPIGILGSLLICTLLYVAVAAVLTGIVSYTTLDTPAPVAYALVEIGIQWGAALVSVGALLGITSVMIVLLFGQSRIFFAMSRDGLLPPVFKKVHPRFRTPFRVTIFVGIVTATLAGFLPLQDIAELVNVGTLAAFIIVSAGVIALRYTRPDIPRPFRCPFVPYLPLLCIVSCAGLIYVLPFITHLRFVIWLIVGLLVYFLYSRRHSILQIRLREKPAAE